MNVGEMIDVFESGYVRDEDSSFGIIERGDDFALFDLVTSEGQSMILGTINPGCGYDFEEQFFQEM